MNEKITSWLKTIIIFAGALYLGILSWNAVKAHNYIGVSDESKHSIAVSGEGEASAIPDIAKIQLGFSLERKTVAAAQAENTAKINEIIKKLKEEFKIEAKDMKTENYSINPRYDWRDGRQILRGYEVSQSLSLKIRQLDDISLILDAAGAIGLNQIGNLSFEIDEPESLKSEAREKAIQAAKDKAEAVAKIVGLKLGRVINFSEAESGLVTPVYRYESLKAADAAGGGPAPEIEAGSTEIKILVTIEYEIL